LNKYTIKPQQNCLKLIFLQNKRSSKKAMEHILKERKRSIDAYQTVPINPVS
jgi:hypothetical protein